MKIERYFVKKDSVNRIFVFYSDSELLLPYLKLLLKDYYKGFGTLDIFFSETEIKKNIFFKEQIKVIKIFAELTNKRHELDLKKLEELLEESFGNKIEEVLAMDKLVKLFKYTGV